MKLEFKYLDYYYGEISKVVAGYRADWEKYGCTIMTDGWTDRKRRTILNFLVHSPNGTIFLKFVDAYKITKTTNKIFKMIDDVVEEVEKNILLKFLRTMQRIIKQQMNFDAKENDVILDTMCRSCHQLDVGIFCEEDPSPQRYNC